MMLLMYKTFNTANVKLGMTNGQVFVVLGKPDSTDLSYSESRRTDAVNYKYPFGGLYFLKSNGEFKLEYLSVKGSSIISFPRDIKIGDSVEYVLSKFPNEGRAKEGTTKMLYGNTQHSLSASFAFISYNKDDQVDSIVYSFQGLAFRMYFTDNLISSIEIFLAM